MRKTLVWAVFFLASSVLLAQPERSKTASYVKVRVRSERPDSSGDQKVRVILEIDDKCTLYGTDLPADLAQLSFKIEVLLDGKPVKAEIVYPRGEIRKDHILGDYSIYQREISIPVVVRRIQDSGPIELILRMQGELNSSAP